MIISDFIIIYLSLGAPFAVYQFVQSRKASISGRLIYAAIYFLLWLPLLIRHGIEVFVRSTARYNLDAQKHEKVREIQQAVANTFRMVEQRISIHEFCEIMDRYVGLSILVKQSADTSGKPNELFAISGHPDASLAAACLSRRNRGRLKRHHIDARKDFLNSIGESSFTNRQMPNSAFKLTELLDDPQASNEVHRIIDMHGKAVQENVRPQENIWIPELQPSRENKSLPANL